MELKFYQKIFKEAYQFPLKVQITRHAPICSGVYLITEIFLGEEVIVYVGSSKQLRSRVYSHPIVNKLKREGIFGNLYVIPMKENVYKEEEMWFIGKLSPKFNKHGINSIT